MGQKVLFVNLLILVGVVILALQLVWVWDHFEKSNNLEQILQKVGRDTEESAETVFPSMEEVRLLSEYLVIAEKNLFSQERRPIRSEPAAEEKAEAPRIALGPYLNGVTTVHGQRRAFITVYEGKAKKGQSKTVEVGDPVQGYTVGEIKDTTLTLLWKDYQKVIDMQDTTRPQQAAAAQKAMLPVTVITIGSAAAAVETTAPEAPAAEAQRGVQVGVVGAQGNVPGGRQGQGLRAGGRGRRGGQGSLGRGRGGMGGRSSSQGRRQQGLSSTVGGSGRGIQAPFGRVRRGNN